MENQDPRTLFGYKLYWRRIAMHLELRDVATNLGTRSVALSQFEKGDFTKLSREQLLQYLGILEMSDQAESYLELLPEVMGA